MTTIKNTERYVRLVLLGIVLAFYHSPAFAALDCAAGQQCTQTLILQPGWNAIYVRVNPHISDPETVFSAIQASGAVLEGVWTWVPKRADVDYVQEPDPNNILSKEGWLNYFPESTGYAQLTNLYAIQANRPYLVKISANSDISLTLTGRAELAVTEWVPDSFNLVGFSIDGATNLTFADYFSASPAHANSRIYGVQNDQWQPIDPHQGIINSDAAYLVSVDGGSNYRGSFEIDLPLLNSMEFGSVINEQKIALQNLGTTPNGYTLTMLGNPAGIYYENPDLQAAQQWLPLQDTHLLLGAGEKRTVTVGVKRSEFASADIAETLSLVAETGEQWLVPLQASAPDNHALWVGSVMINQVSQAQSYLKDCVALKQIQHIVMGVDSNGDDILVEIETLQPNIESSGTGYDLCISADDPATAENEKGLPISAGSGVLLTPTAQDFSFRVIVHDANGQLSLLKDVIHMLKAPVGIEGQAGYEPARSVLLTNDALISNYEGVVLRDGVLTGRRISTVGYDFVGEALPIAGSLSANMTVSVITPADAATNPFRHHYHNEHGGDGYAIVRDMTFTVGAGTDPDFLSDGYSRIAGTYQEVITGLHKTPIVSAGTFELFPVISVDTLNDQ